LSVPGPLVNAYGFPLPTASADDRSINSQQWLVDLEPHGVPALGAGESSGDGVMSGLRLVRATGLDELYQKSGWPPEDGPLCDRRLAAFIFRNLQGSDYAAAGYGSIEDVLTGDIEMIRRLALTPESDVHLYAVLESGEMRAFMLWYSLEAGGLELLPPDDRTQRALPPGCSLRDIAYGDWLIVDASSRVRGLGGLLFAMLLHDMARSGYRFWYGRTVVPDNRDLYERLYRRKGRAELIGEWQDGAVRRIGFLGDLQGGWTEALLQASREGGPELLL
jgi:hypothetical protein